MHRPNIKEEFVVRLSVIALGKHCYSIICNKSFFEISEMKELVDGEVKVQIEMEKGENMLNFLFHFCGNVEVACERCLDTFTLPLHFTEFLVVNLVPFVEADFDNSENVWQIQEKAHELDLFHFLYESIKLALPPQLAHLNTSECNPEMLKKLAQLAPKKNENNDKTETDPRWNALKNLTFEN